MVDVHDVTRRLHVLRCLLLGRGLAVVLYDSHTQQLLIDFADFTRTAAMRLTFDFIDFFIDFFIDYFLVSRFLDLM